MQAIEGARLLAARGARVFPLGHGSRFPRAGQSWLEVASADADMLPALLEGATGYGVACGAGLLVLDVDVRDNKDGYASLAAYPVLPTTFSVRTPRGGRHFYFKTDIDVTNRIGFLPGLDVKSAGGYVIGPGSVTEFGNYAVVSDAPFAPAPAWLLDAIGTYAASQEPRIDGPEDDRLNILAAISYLVTSAPHSVEGQGGNDTAYRVASRLHGLGLSQAKILEFMRDYWNDDCTPPWSVDELYKFSQNAKAYAQNGCGDEGPVEVTARLVAATAVAVSGVAAPAGSKFEAMFAARKLRAEQDIPRRPWLADGLLMRGEVSILAGPGGAGKSGFAIGLAAHGATGKAFAGFDVPTPFRSVVYNLEDSRAEMEGRVYATCHTGRLPFSTVEDGMLLWSGQDAPLRLMTPAHIPNLPDIAELLRLLGRDKYDALILDPFVSLHSELENDNVAMGAVMDLLKHIARTANVAILVVHHTSKATGSAAGSANASRGASNIVNSARSVVTLYPADEHDAAACGFGEGYKGRYVRVDRAKINSGPLDSRPTWLDKKGYALANGDTSYALVPAEIGGEARKEADIVAAIIADHMLQNGLYSMPTHHAAKVLVDADPLYRDMLPSSGSGSLTVVKAWLELRLVAPVTVEGMLVKTELRTERGVTRKYVNLERPAALPVVDPYDGWS